MTQRKWSLDSWLLAVLELAGALQSFASRLRGYVEQQNREARVGDVRGNLRAHRARAQHRDGSDRNSGRVHQPAAVMLQRQSGKTH